MGKDSSADLLKNIKELSACEQAVPYTDAEKRELVFAGRNIKRGSSLHSSV